MLMCLCHRDHFYIHQPGETLVRRFKGCLKSRMGQQFLQQGECSSLRTAPKRGCPLPTPRPTRGCLCLLEGPPVLGKGLGAEMMLGAEMLLEEFVSQCSTASLHGGRPSPRAVFAWGIVLPRRQLPCCQSADFQRISNVSRVSFPLTGLLSCCPWRGISVPPRQGTSYDSISWLQINSALALFLSTITAFSNVLRSSLKSVANQNGSVVIPGLQRTALGTGNSPAQACAGRFEASCPLGDLWDSSSGGDRRCFVLLWTWYLLPVRSVAGDVTRESPFVLIHFLQDLFQDVGRCKTNKEEVFSLDVYPQSRQGFSPCCAESCWQQPPQLECSGMWGGN